MEKIALVVSEADPASLLILKKINEIGFPSWAQEYSFKEDMIHVDPSKIKENRVIFLSRHKSAAGTKSLTVHFLGNFSKAELGGEEGKLSGVLPQVEANYLRALEKKTKSSGLAGQSFSVCLEVTHHGPLTDKGCVFIEIGSSEADWGNELAGRIIAETVIEETFKEGGFSPEKKDTVVIGIGGGHYAPDFTKLILRQAYAFGHICPQYALEHLNEDLLKQMIEKSGASEIVLDWKGLKTNKEKVVKLCEATGLPVKRVQNLLGH